MKIIIIVLRSCNSLKGKVTSSCIFSNERATTLVSSFITFGTTTVEIHSAYDNQAPATNYPFVMDNVNAPW